MQHHFFNSLLGMSCLLFSQFAFGTQFDCKRLGNDDQAVSIPPSFSINVDNNYHTATISGIKMRCSYEDNGEDSMFCRGSLETHVVDFSYELKTMEIYATLYPAGCMGSECWGLRPRSYICEKYLSHS